MQLRLRQPSTVHERGFYKEVQSNSGGIKILTLQGITSNI
jgi:hypothetical protein